MRQHPLKQDGDSSAIVGNGDRDSDSMVDDEACFVDGWEGNSQLSVRGLRLARRPS
jgi:hypothetical protein